MTVARLVVDVKIVVESSDIVSGMVVKVVKAEVGAGTDSEGKGKKELVADPNASDAEFDSDPRDAVDSSETLQMDESDSVLTEERLSSVQCRG